VDDPQVDRTLERVAQGNGLSLADFRRVLERDGVRFEKFREEVRDQILLTRLREREVDDRIEVSEAEIELYLQEHKPSRAGRAEYNVAHILVRLPEQASPERIEQARAKAEKARAEAAAGGDFGRLAAASSDAADALQGGSMGWRAEDRLPELFASTLRAMKPGAVSGVLRSPAGFHVLKLVEARSSGAGAPVVQTRARHILVRTSEIVSEADARRKLLDLRERVVVGKVDFAQLARQHSEDGTAARGGDLDWVFPGDTVPEFERAMNELKPGEVSAPVRTSFGLHLIEVLERREAGLTADRQRLQARQAIKERKSDEAFQDWLRQLRDRAYVEIRLDQL
jgi:peptidyl-prolyl cis-trans isomerase SurA